MLAAKALVSGYIPSQYVNELDVPFKPLMAYASSDAPGASLLSRLFYNVIWDDIYHPPSHKLSMFGDRNAIGFSPVGPLMKVSLFRAMRDEHGLDDTPSPSQGNRASANGSIIA